MTRRDAGTPPARASSAGAVGELKIRNLSKSFGGLQVFRDVSFDLPAGSVLGIIGPNGAGKTTLINVVCGMLAPSAGRIILDDEDIGGLGFAALSRRGVVRSFQQTNTFRSETVHENLARAMRFSGAGRASPDDDLLLEFGLADVLHERSDRLPYGSQKMLGLLMAYLTRPRILLLDEPAAGLERSERSRVDRLVQAAQERLGCSVLIVEHDMDLLKRVCPTSVVLEAGRILGQGITAEVLSRPEVIAAYVGSIEEEEG